MSWRASLKLKGRVQVQCCLWPEASGSQGSRMLQRHPQREREKTRRKGKKEHIKHVCLLGSISLLQLIAAGTFCGTSWFKYWVTRVVGCERSFTRQWGMFIFSQDVPTFLPCFIILQLLQSYSGLCTQVFCHLRKAKLCYTAMPLKGRLKFQPHTDAKYSNGPEWNNKEHSLAFPQTLPDSLQSRTLSNPFQPCLPPETKHVSIKGPAAEWGEGDLTVCRNQ